MKLLAIVGLMCIKLVIEVALFGDGAVTSNVLGLMTLKLFAEVALFITIQRLYK